MMADPVGIENDWYLIEETVKEGLMDIKSGQELFVEEVSIDNYTNLNIFRITLLFIK